jgi:starch synthase
MPQKKLSILIAAAECAPFAKVGGLADVIGSLPQALSQQGVNVSVVLPKYGLINNKKFDLKIIADHLVVGNDKNADFFSVYNAKLKSNSVNYYFIDHPYFKSNEIYIHKKRIRRRKGIAYSRSPIDIRRFSLFSQAVVEMIHQLPLPVSLIHCNDWHAGLIPTFVDELAVTKSYRFTKTLLSIHNLANQGITPLHLLKKLELVPSSTPYIMEDYYDHDGEVLNLMKLGILSADLVNTVSPNYAREILGKEYGAGLQSYLNRRKKHLSGILNGIDLDFFNPAKDKLIYKKYSKTSWKAGKAVNKNKLQSELNLPKREIPLYGLVSRLVHQKGFDILAKSLRIFLKKDVQVAILGTGQKKIEQEFKALAKQYPNKISTTIDFNIGLAQKIYAGSDFFLMPSRFEPCGLGQMIAMRYGTVPVVRATGGLKDTVNPEKTGVVFLPYSSTALNQALAYSLKLYNNKPKWYTMVNNCLKQDFSWNSSAKEYIKLYKELV